MPNMAGLSDLVEQIRETSRNIEASDSTFSKRLDGIEESVNELFRKTQRPAGFADGRDDASAERKHAAELCIVKHNLTVPKDNGSGSSYVPSSGEIDEALTVRTIPSPICRPASVKWRSAPNPSLHSVRGQGYF